jgi:hypothetical protein
MPVYRAFLLRCWSEGERTPEQHPDWRFSLIEIGREQRQRGFASFEALVEFIASEVIGKSEESSPEDDSL